MVSDNGSPKIVEASSKATACLARFDRALGTSHSNVNGIRGRAHCRQWKLRTRTRTRNAEGERRKRKTECLVSEVAPHLHSLLPRRGGTMRVSAAADKLLTVSGNGSPREA